MSRKNNVNPDHYKTAGRDRPNARLVPTPMRPTPLRATRARVRPRKTA
jgi:hypothetical protein